ncbi:MAG: dephospho-CoA kinase [Gammaproteobacteria bacterium]
MFRVGLTGGIASGKTTVAALFTDLGAGLVDTDRVAREVVAAGEPGLEAIVEAFGADILLDSGDLNRSALRAIVFGDPDERRKLEALLHPLIRARTLAQLEALEAPYAVVVVPLLVETDFAQFVDRVLVVDCPRELQLERLVRRDQISAADAEAILAAQVDRETRSAHADDILDGSQSLPMTRERVGILHTDYLRRAADSNNGS